MTPKTPNNSADLFRAQLSQMLSMSRPLVCLPQKVNWEKLEAEVDLIYSDAAGQSSLPTRLLVGLRYLKYAFNESVVKRWVENPYWQYFCGYEYLQHKLPLRPTSLTRWRELDHVNVNTTMQEKAITFPTDAKLYQRMREHLVCAAQAHEIRLRQSYVKIGKKALIMQGRCSHARQSKRVAKQTRKLKTYLGRVIRDTARKATKQDEALTELLNRAKRFRI